MSPAEFRDRKHRQHQQTKQQQPTGNVRGQPFGALSNQPFEVDPNLFPIVMPGLGRANLSYGRYTDPLKSLDPEFQQWYGDENSVASLEGARERWSTVRRWKVETDRWKRAKGLWKVVVAEGEVAGSDKKGDAADDLDRIDDMNEDPLAKEITDPLGFHVVVSGMSEAVPPPQQSSKMRDSATTEGRLDDTADIEAALRDQVEFWSEDEDLPASGGVSRPSPLSDSKRRSDENSSPSVSSGWNVPTFRGLLSKAQDVIRSLGEESVVRQRAPSQTAKLGESTRILEKAKVQRSDVATAASSRPSYTSFLVPVNGIPEMFNRPIMVHSSLLPADVKPNRRTSTQSPLRTEMPRVRIEGPLTESEGKVAGVNHFNEDFGDVTRATMKNSSSDEFVVASNLTPAILVSEDDPDPPTLPMVCIENATVVFDNGLPLDHHPTPFGKPRGDLLSEEWGDQVSVEPRALPQSRGTKSAVVQQPKKVPLETMRGPSYLKRHSEAPKLPVLEMSRSNASSTEFSMEVPGSAPNEIQNQIEHAVGLATAVPFIAVTSASFDSAKKNATVTAKPSGTAPKIVPSVGIFQPGTVANIVSDSGEATTSKVQTPIPPRQPQAFLSDEDLSFPPYNFALALRRRTGSNESVLNQDMLDRGAGDV
ncbi:hypothetical protein M427DRAFT_53802 [Gonapodya prolifera JEL478]|uniref:Uncharacterized protein n=1 Tax=Gonapodya prolifera (strain JEL478) TaxID=1344416 RepID=A0A139APK0_GONPJ|nr:hypothetical protein M427DRAFT_53802 [Gonapodya prolifera JEL478]|eukprot:KXS18415.1 hypothetical protein M427DRAFT_53802 [Gonapodya prolifera JEL478]